MLSVAAAGAAVSAVGVAGVRVGLGGIKGSGCSLSAGGAGVWRVLAAAAARGHRPNWWRRRPTVAWDGLCHPRTAASESAVLRSASRRAAAAAAAAVAAVAAAVAAADTAVGRGRGSLGARG